MRWNTTMVIGLFFLVLGLSIVLKAVFKIDFPVIRVLFGVLLIYFGIKVALGSFGLCGHCSWKSDSSAFFSERTFKPGVSDKDVLEYHVAFGKGVVDLTDLPASPAGKRVHINTAFGECIVIWDHKTPIRIRANSLFGEAALPNGNTVAFGNLNYQSPSASGEAESVGAIIVEANVFMGALRFQSKGE